MGKTVWRASKWTPYSEGVDGGARRSIMLTLRERIDTLQLKAGRFDGYVALQLPINRGFRTSDVLTVACEWADKRLPISVNCYTWGFQYIDQDVAAFFPVRWAVVDPETGLRVRR